MSRDREYTGLSENLLMVVGISGEGRFKVLVVGLVG